MKYFILLLFAYGCTNSTDNIAKKGLTKTDVIVTQNSIDSIKGTIADTDKSPENNEWNGNIYRNKKYKFRVEFPRNWEYDAGTTKHTVARAINKKDGVTISILVQHLSEKAKSSNNIFENESEADFKNALEIMGPLQKKKFANFEIKKGYLNNFPAYICSMTQTVLSGDREFAYLTKQIKSYCDSKIYQITLNIPLSLYSYRYNSLFTRVIDSFNFEIAY